MLRRRITSNHDHRVYEVSLEWLGGFGARPLGASLPEPPRRAIVFRALDRKTAFSVPCQCDALDELAVEDLRQMLDRQAR